jgi:hypothetical protein
MSKPAKRVPTANEMEAANIIHELASDSDEIDVTDENKYQALVERRKKRGPVSLKFIAFFIV